MKKVLALVLAFAMVFSSISFVFAEDVVSDEAAALSTIGMLEGDGGGVTAEYETKELNKLTGAIMILKLKGLYEEALEYDGVDNFEDAEEVKWEEGRNILAYLKDNPAVGFIGSEGKFGPTETLSEQMLYKVLLENLGYKQVTADVADGDFAWEETLEFAEGLGLVPANPEVFTIGELSKAVVAALKTNIKDGKAWIEVLVENEKVAIDDAVAAGFMAEAPGLVEVAVKEAKALGNTVVEVKFKEEVGAEAENLDNYAIEGLEIVDAALAGEKVVRLETAAMTKGKVYKLVVGEDKVEFTGIAKVSGAPEIDGKPVSEDVDEVVIKFTKNIDLATGSDVANFTIAGVDVVGAAVDGDEVTLTTEGLKNRTNYTVKVANIKSVDGAAKKADSKSFRTNFDFTAPSIKGDIERETFQRIVVNFTEKVTQDSAEDIENYAIKLNKTDGEELEILEITWDDDDENNVTIVTEAMERNKEYKITVNNIADQRKTPNVMTRPASKTFKGLAEDKTGPKVGDVTVLSPEKVLVVFTDDSKIDADSALDLANYELKDLDIYDIEKHKDSLGEFKVILTVEEMETGKGYELKINDILDEFGNEMKNEYKKTIRATENVIASVKLNSAKATGKNKIELVFSGEVDKSSAESISNYEVSEGIGAPTKAKLESNKTTVTLTVADLISWNDSSDAYYEVTVDGVEDLATNVLFYEMDLDTWTSPWDKDNPKLEDVDAANKYVVALEFDEKVEQLIGETVKLQIVEYDTDADEWDSTPIDLDFGDIVEDDTVVEFNYSTGLDPEKRYAVYKVVYNEAEDGGIVDLAGNPFLATSFELGEFEFTVPNEDIEAPYMENYEQKDGKTFEVTFSKNVEIKDGEGTQTAGNLTFTLSLKSDRSVVKFVANGKIKDGTDYEFKFKEIFTDKYEVDAEEEDEGKTILTGEYTDDDEPYIDDVVAKNRYVIKVVFDEHINGTASTLAGYFELKNYDLDKSITITTGDSETRIDKNVLYLKLSKPLESRYEYELKFKKNKGIKDLVGNELKNEEDVYYYFDGTNLAN